MYASSINFFKCSSGLTNLSNFVFEYKVRLEQREIVQGSSNYFVHWQQSCFHQSHIMTICNHILVYPSVFVVLEINGKTTPAVTFGKKTKIGKVKVRESSNPLMKVRSSSDKVLLSTSSCLAFSQQLKVNFHPKSHIDMIIPCLNHIFKDT